MPINPISDPYLRKRIVLPSSIHSSQSWIGLLIILFVCLVIAGWYFAPYLRSYWQTVKKPVLASPTVPELPVVKNEPAKQPIAPTTESVTPQVNKQPQPINPVTPPTPPPPAAIIETPPAVPVPPPNVADNLLAKAQAQLARERFTSPEGDNAYQTYQELVKLSPQQAEPILDAIVTWYVGLGRKYLNEGKLTFPKQMNALKMYEKVREIAPNHPVLPAFLNELLAAFNERITRQLQDNKVIEPDNDNAYTTYQELATIALEHENTQRLLQKLLAVLFTQAQKQVNKLQYTSPPKDNAYDTYGKILKISPNNRRAQEGIRFMVEQFYWTAVNKQKQQDYETSLTMVEKGLQIDPQHSALLKLKEELKKVMK